jgi:hypothetical protein
VQFFAKVQRQLFGSLGFNDPFVLLKNTAVPRVQLIVGFGVAVVAPRKAIKLCLVRSQGRAKINIGMSLDATRLPPLNNNHER